MVRSDPIFPVPIPVDGDSVQAREVPGTATHESTGAFRSTGFPELVTTSTHPDYPKTVYDVLMRSMRLRPNANAFGWRAVDKSTMDLAKEYSWYTFAQAEEHIRNIGSALLHLAATGVIDTQGDVTGWTVANWMPNRPEWQFVNLAASCFSLVQLSLYDTLGPGVVEYCINHAGAKVVFASPSHIPAILKLSEKCPGVKLVVSVDNFEDMDLKNGGRPYGGLGKKAALQEWGASKGIKVIDLAELETIGRANPQPYKPAGPDDLYAIMYTSGTTGMPKGAMILQRNIVASAIGQAYGNAETEAGDLHISYLPLSHIYQQFVEIMCMLVGVGLGYFSGDMLRLIEDIQVLKPHTMVAVPRVLNRFYQVIKAGTLDAPGLKGSLSRRAFESAIAQLESETPSLPSALNIYDMLVFRKIRQAFGGRLRFLSSGSAPIAPEVLKFFTVALGRNAIIVEGYGQTEAMGTAVRCIAHDFTAYGYVGPPLPCNEIKLLDVPDMNYLHTDKPYPRGEILVRGENVFPGYYKDEKNTKETLDADGWLHSGDIGYFDAKGRLRIIDRKKNLLKLSQGEYVALEKVENTYALSPIILQILVHGDSLRDHLVAIVVPEPVAFTAFMRRIGRSVQDGDLAGLAKLMQEPEVNQAVLKELHKYHQGKLQGFEQIKAIHLSPQPFPEDLVTPTMKIKRQPAGKHYKDVIDRLYAEKASSAAPKREWKL